MLQDNLTYLNKDLALMRKEIKQKWSEKVPYIKVSEEYIGNNHQVRIIQTQIQSLKHYLKYS